MSDRNEYNYFDFDNFDEDTSDSREYRRRQPERRQSSSSGRRPAYNTRSARPTSRPSQRPSQRSNQRPSQRPSSRRKSSRQNRTRTRNRIVIVLSGIIILAVIFFALGSLFSSCGNKQSEKPEISTSPVTQPGQPTTAATQPTTASQESGDDLSVSVFKAPQIQDDKSTGALSGGVYYWKGTAFELFGSSDDRAENYANTINGFADKLGANIKVYDMIVPNHTEMGLPDRIKGSEVTSTSQADNMKAAYAKMSSKVTPINPYNYLSKHNNEYIYFNTDHHWSGLGAYYAYSAFADTLKLPLLDLSTCTENKIENFTGTLFSSAYQTQNDTVSYWDFPYDVSMEITDASGNTQTYDSPYYKNATEGTLTYGVFVMGDNPQTVLKSSSPSAEKGKRILVVKESYGNAFVPYLTYDYEEVHIADLRTFPHKLPQYCADNGIGEVLFLNGVMSANTQSQLDNMSALF